MTCCHCTAAKSDPEPGSLSRSRCGWACCLMWGPVLPGWEWLPQLLQAPACRLACPRQDGATA